MIVLTYANVASLYMSKGLQGYTVNTALLLSNSANFTTTEIQAPNQQKLRLSIIYS